jgi:hypothetical protein
VLQGSVPGTERWLLCLRSPSFQRSAELRLIRAQSTLSGRQAQIAAYKQLVLADRAAEERAIVATGGRVLRHFWMEDVIEVEVAPSAVPGLRGLTRVVRAVPVQARQMADAGMGTSANDHIHAGSETVESVSSGSGVSQRRGPGPGSVSRSM